MKRGDLILSTILVPTDYLMLILTAILIYYLRFNIFVNLRPVIYEIPFFKYLVISALVALVWLLIFIFNGFYLIRDSRNFWQEFSRVFTACSVGIFFILLFIFLKREFFSSRFIILAAWPCSIVLVLLGRTAVYYLRRQIFKHGKWLQHILVIGPEEKTRQISNFFAENPETGYVVEKTFPDFRSLDLYHSKKPEELLKIDEIVQIDSNALPQENQELVEFAAEHHLNFKYATNLYGASPKNTEVKMFFGRPIVEIKRTSLEGWGKIFKRTFDILVTLLILPFFFLLYLIIGILIKLDSEGPVIVKLERVGERGKKFKLYKFRSMVKDAHLMKQKLMTYNERADGPLFKLKNDPRITKFGKFLRKSSLDELPQLINVLKGEMSLVGPRPHEQEEVARYQKYHKRLLTIKPGMTGLAQISGRSILKFSEEANLDIFYIENWSPWLDLQILFKTIPVVLKKEGAV